MERWLWLSVVCSLAAVHSVNASGPYCGCVNFSASPCCDAQSCFPACQQQSRICYKLVCENVQEKRWHTCYKTVQKTVNEQVCRTIMKPEIRQVSCPSIKRVLVDQTREIMVPVRETVMKTETYTVCKPVQETRWTEVRCKTIRKVSEVAYRDQCEIIRKPVYETAISTHQIQKQVCEQHMKEICVTCTKPVCETHYQTICCQVNKCVNEARVKTCCTTVCNDVCETCYKECVTKVCKPVTTMKCVTRRCGGWCTETYCVPGRCYTEWVDQCCTDSLLSILAPALRR